jgi:hypothetical protein
MTCAQGGFEPRLPGHTYHDRDECLNAPRAGEARLSLRQRQGRLRTSRRANARPIFMTRPRTPTGLRAEARRLSG